jgi:hypothetical protein
MPTTVTAPPAAPSITPPPVTVSAAPVCSSCNQCRHHGTGGCSCCPCARRDGRRKCPCRLIHSPFSDAIRRSIGYSIVCAIKYAIGWTLRWRGTRADESIQRKRFRIWRWRCCCFDRRRCFCCNRFYFAVSSFHFPITNANTVVSFESRPVVCCYLSAAKVPIALANNKVVAD